MALLEPPAAPAISSVPGPLLEVQPTWAVDLPVPIWIRFALSTFVPVPKLSVLLAVPATAVAVPVEPGVVIVLSPMSIVPAVMVLF